ncbi:MAG: hypothetical protein KC978_24255, partial [Candidatus Omnitrophica bacterium]|nr:hypothetical protein [Candidatus Omnitrophota bacterium]
RGPGLVGELCTYSLFTTPIKYIDKLCFDPFVEERNDPGFWKSYSLPEYTSYLSGTIQRKEWGETFGLYYAILSRGPDLQRNVGNYNELFRSLGSHTHHITECPLIYSPTNGARSPGDMVVSNRGHEGR